MNLINNIKLITALAISLLISSCSIWNKSNEFDSKGFPYGTNFYRDTTNEILIKATNDFAKEHYNKKYLKKKQKAGVRTVYAVTINNEDTLSYYKCVFIRDNTINKNDLTIFKTTKIEHVAYKKESKLQFISSIQINDSSNSIDAYKTQRDNISEPFLSATKVYKPKNGELTENDIIKYYVKTAKYITKHIHSELIRLGKVFEEHNESVGKDTINKNLSSDLLYQVESRQNFYENCTFNDSISSLLINGVDMNKILDYQVQLKDINTKDELLNLNPIDFVSEFAHDPENIDYYYFLAAIYKKCFLLTGNLIYAYTYKTTTDEISKKVK